MNWRMIAGGAALLSVLAGCGGGDELPTCAEGETLCGPNCVQTAADPRHCGACDVACGANELCAEGACQVECPTGQTECSGGCFTLQSSRAHCGACDNACGETFACVEGTCSTTCPGAQTLCDGACADTTTDASHCGACGNACLPDQACVGGSCAVVCADNLEDCGGACRNLQSDPRNCGACGNTCGTHELCSEGACVLTCAGFTPDECDGACTNLQVDPQNCGACGTACASGEVCSAGACASECDAAADVCGGSCTDTSFDPNNCGVCGVSCPVPGNGLAVCSASTCGAVCQENFADCDFDLNASGSNGCEANLMSSPDHCGGCGVQCLSDVTQVAACNDGVCGRTCQPGYTDCDGDPSNGCEVQTASDAANCGGCGVACGAAEYCNAGLCAPVVGDVCAAPADIYDGANTIPWVATALDYITTTPSCVSVGTIQGPDIVLRYVATANGTVKFNFPNKPTNNRWVALVFDAPCGTLTPQLACISDWSPAFMEGTISATAGTTYYLYVASTTSGGAPLNNPLDVVVTVTP